MFKIRNPNHPMAVVGISVAAVAPAALFAIFWRILNSDFLPGFGQGANGLLACISTGVLFWVWSCMGLFDAFKRQNVDAFVKERARYIYWNLIASLFTIPAGRIVFSVLPPWSNVLGAILGVCFGYLVVTWCLSKGGRGRFIHNRGTLLLSYDEATKRIRALPTGPEPRIKWAGFALPGEVAPANFLVAGAIGMGKTRMHREIMASIIPSILPGSDRRLLIYDVKADLLSELYGMNPPTEVLILNPFDTRSVAWDVAADVQTPDQARHFTESLILPAKEGDSTFFINAARAIVTGVINALNLTHSGKWDLRHLIRLTATRARLEQVLAGSDLIEQFFSPADTFANIQNTIATVMVELESVAALWQQTQRKISLKEWVKTGDSVLVIGGREEHQASLQLINRVAVKVIAVAFLSERESGLQSRLWFFCDELKSAGRLDALPLLLNARSKGVRCVLGFQDIEGLNAANGNPEITKEVLNRCSNVSWLRLNSPDTSAWACQRAGDAERFEYMESRTSGKDGNTVSEHLAKREAFLASEFQNLAEYTSGNVDAIHAIRGLGGVFRATSHYEHPRTEVPDYDPRPPAQLQLAPWTKADDDWLAQGRSKAEIPNKPNGSEPDLGSLGRITF